MLGMKSKWRTMVMRTKMRKKTAILRQRLNSRRSWLRPRQVPLCLFGICHTKRQNKSLKICSAPLVHFGMHVLPWILLPIGAEERASSAFGSARQLMLCFATQRSSSRRQVQQMHMQRRRHRILSKCLRFSQLIRRHRWSHASCFMVVFCILCVL